MFYVKFHKTANRSQIIKMLQEQYAVVSMPRLQQSESVYQLVFENNTVPENIQSLLDKETGLIFIPETKIEDFCK